MDRSILIDELDEIVYLSDPETYELLYVNRPGMKLMGVTEETLRGRKCYEVIQGFDAPCSFCTTPCLCYEDFYCWEYTNNHVGRHYLLKDKLIDWNGSPARIEFAIDITDKENVSRALQDKLEIEDAMVECIGSLFSVDDLNEAIRLVLGSIGCFYRADRVYIFELDMENHECNNTYEWCNDGIEPEMDRLQHIPLSYVRRWMKFFQRNQPVVINDLSEIGSEFADEYNTLKMQNIHSLRALPLTIQNTLTGYVGLDNPAEHADDLSLLDSLSYFIMNEISKRRVQAHLRYMTYHDTLTGLPNQNSYADYIASRRSERLRSLGAAVADINGLKRINENYGHDYGDQALRNVSDVLREYFDPKTIFRLNGDEMVVLAEDYTREDFIHRIRQAREKLDCEWDGCTIGYTWTDMDVDVQQLVHHADELMYIEKQNYYRSTNIASKHHDPMAIQRLTDAIEAGRFKMFLQPKADIRTGKICGAEALARLDHPKNGLQSPASFIPMLEKEKLIKYIDLFIYEETCRMLARWRQEGRPLIPVSLNFSRITLLESNLINTLVQIHEKYDFPRELIEIEITETIGEMERETIAEIGTNIRQQGFSIALDDFGAKYTSMSMLTILEFDVLKLDRSLVYNLEENSSSRVVVKHIVEMCREMGAQSVAEGVETNEQLELLRSLGCDQAQGYLYSQPVPCTEFEQKYQ